MLVDRRSLLKTIPSAPAVLAIAPPLEARQSAYAPIALLADQVKRQLGVSGDVAAAALARLRAHVGDFGIAAAPTDDPSLAAIGTTPPYVRGWSLSQHELSRSIAVLSPAAESAIAFAATAFRPMGDCTFGGVTVALYRRRRVAVGLISLGQVGSAGAYLQFSTPAAA
jgi:hypothetical protein